MIFSELYSAYYNTIAGILSMAVSADATDKDIRKQIAENAFSESALTILSALKYEKWPLLDRNLATTLKHTPTMPLTDLERRWLKSISCDPRIRLFGVDFAELDSVEPLFTSEDYSLFDKYSDGDPYEDEGYISRFRLISDAIRTGRPVSAEMKNRRGTRIKVRFHPERLEYSEKDDKFRVLVSDSRFISFNLGRFTRCGYYTGKSSWYEKRPAERLRELVLMIEDRKNALERVMMHFAHFEKEAERVDETHYRMRIRYYKSDETEIVIRVLSFGPYVKVIEPKAFSDLIKERLISQKECDLR